MVMSEAVQNVKSKMGRCTHCGMNRRDVPVERSGMNRRDVPDGTSLQYVKFIDVHCIHHHLNMQRRKTKPENLDFLSGERLRGIIDVEG